MKTDRTLPRRRLLAGVFALPAVAVAAAMPALASAEPDAELLELGRQHQAATAHYHALGDRAEAAYDAALAQHPPKPEALRIQPGDWFVPHSAEGQARLGGFHDGEAVARWRRAGEPQTAMSLVMSEQLRARRAEILPAWEWWVAEKERLNVACGLRAREAEADAAGKVVWVLEDRTFEARAHTMEGLRLKARIALHVLGDKPDGTYEDHLARSILADLTASPGQGAV